MEKACEKKSLTLEFECEYRDKYLNSYREATKAYNKNWSEWILKGRNSIEEFCKYYICWLCDDDKTKADNILKGKCDFENDFSKRDWISPQGRRLISLIYQEHGGQLRKFISDQKLNSTYSTLSEFIHNSLTPTIENTTPIKRVLERLYSIYMWTTNKNYSDIKEDESFIRIYHSSIKFITPSQDTRYIMLSNIDVKIGHEGDYVIVIDRRHNFILDRYYTDTYSLESIRDLLQRDWIVLRQNRNKFVEIEFDYKKVNDEIQWGIEQLKAENEEPKEDVDDLFEKIVVLESLYHMNPEPVEARKFLNIYYLIRRLEPVVTIIMDDKRWLVKRDKIRAEDMDLIWGDNVRIYIEGLDYNREYIEMGIDVKIPSSAKKSKIIKLINSHQYQSITLNSVANILRYQYMT